MMLGQAAGRWAAAGAVRGEVLEAVGWLDAAGAKAWRASMGYCLVTAAVARTVAREAAGRWVPEAAAAASQLSDWAADWPVKTAVETVTVTAD